MEQFLDLSGAGLTVLPPNSQPGHFTSQFVKPERDADSLLARHGTIAGKLSFQRGLGRHTEPT